MTLAVQELALFTLRLPFRFSFAHALAAREETTNVLVRVRLSDGAVGWGEGVPRDYVTGETVDSCLEVVRERLGPAVLGAEVRDPDDVVPVLEEALPFPAGVGENTDGAARCAVELALLDAFGHAFGLPATHWLGGAVTDAVRYDAIVPFASPRKLAGIALLCRAAGLTTLKLKVGADPAKDAAALGVLRRLLGARADIRVDANAAWTPESAPRELAALRRFGISAVEQPVPPWPVEGMARVTAAVPELVIADESLRTLEEAEQLAALRGCDAFNIRVSKCGGLLPSRRIAETARQAGIVAIVGAQVGESGILSAAGRALATCIAPRYVEGSAGTLLLKEDIVAERILPGRRGVGRAFAGRGLGITMRGDAIARLATPVATLAAGTPERIH